MARAEHDDLTYAKNLGFLDDGYTGSGHLKVRHPANGNVVTLPATPSDTVRGRRNVRAQLRRAAPPEAVEKLKQRKASRGKHRRARKLSKEEREVQQQRARAAAYKAQQEADNDTARKLKAVIDAGRNGLTRKK